MIKDGRTPPHDPDAERAVLGACLVNERALTLVVAELSSKDFYSETNRVVFSAIKSAARKGPVDFVTVVDELKNVDELDKVGGKARVLDLVEGVPTGANAGRYAEIIVRAARAREAIDCASRLKESCYGRPDEYSRAPERAISELEDVLRRDGNKGGAGSFEDAYEDFVDEIERSESSEGVVGIRTGIPKLDQGLGGIQDEFFVVIAARPGMGKSLVVAQIALNSARQGKRTLVSSPEMSKKQYLKRLAAASAGVRWDRVTEGRMSKDEKSRLYSEALKIVALPLYCNDRPGQTVGDIRRDALRHEPDMILVDYLQKLAPDDGRASRVDQVSQISQDVDALKKQFRCGVVAAAQLSRAVEQRNDKRPMLSDLRDSGAIEQDADQVVMPFRPAYYDEKEPDDVIEFHVEKNRHGSIFHTTQYLAPGLHWVVGGRDYRDAVA